MTPPSEPPFKWRHDPDSPITVSAAAFARLVAENNLKPIEVDGYLWAWLPTEDGYDTYRAYGPKWKMLYQARRVVTQDNAGGGALTIRISVASGKTAKLVEMFAYGPASAGATLEMRILDEDGSVGPVLSSVAAGANRSSSLPQIGTTNTTSNTIDSNGLILGPGQYVRIAASAALQTETLEVFAAFLLPNNAAAGGTDITWDTTGSAGTPNLAASTISAANTLQAVLLP